MDAALKESLSRRVARLRIQVGRTVATAQDTNEWAREVSDQTARARRRRWTARYERALEKNEKKLGALTLGDD